MHLVRKTLVSLYFSRLTILKGLQSQKDCMFIVRIIKSYVRPQRGRIKNQFGLL